MTQTEWLEKTDDWRTGWRYGQGDVYIEPKENSDFIDGYLYALEHPAGSCYSVSATTGLKVGGQYEDVV